MCQQKHTYTSMWRQRHNLDAANRQVLNGIIRELVGALALFVTACPAFVFLVFYGFGGVSAYLNTQIPVADRPLMAYAAVSFMLFIGLSLVAFVIGAISAMIIGGWRAHRANTSVLRGALLGSLLGPPSSSVWITILGRVYTAVISTGLAIGLVYHLHVTWGWNLAVAGVSGVLCALSLPSIVFSLDRFLFSQSTLAAANERCHQQETT